MNYKLITLLNKNKDISKELECMKYPFNNIEDGIYTQIPFRENNVLYSINFPNTIKDLYYCKEGCNDETPWILIGKLNNGKYFYYIAGCDYTGFGCRGFMYLYIESVLENLIDYALSKYVRLQVATYYEDILKKYNCLQLKLCDDLITTIFKYIENCCLYEDNEDYIGWGSDKFVI